MSSPSGVPAGGWHPGWWHLPPTEATSALAIGHHRGAAPLLVAPGHSAPSGWDRDPPGPHSIGWPLGQSRGPACLIAQTLLLPPVSRAGAEQCRSGAVMTFWLEGDPQRVPPQAQGLLPAPRAHPPPSGSQRVPAPEQLPGMPRHSAAVGHGDTLVPRQTTASARAGSEVSPPGSSLQHPAPPSALEPGAGRVLWPACCPPPCPMSPRHGMCSKLRSCSSLHRAPARPCAHMPDPSGDTGSRGRAQPGAGHLQPGVSKELVMSHLLLPIQRDPGTCSPRGVTASCLSFPICTVGLCSLRRVEVGGWVGRGCQQGL